MAMTEDSANDWLLRYGQAWERADTAAAGALFSADCRYYETPFAAPEVGRAGVTRYWQNVEHHQRDVRFRHRLIAVQYNTVIAHWSAGFSRVGTGARVTLDGIFVLEFDDRGLCHTLREWWGREERPQFD